MVNQIRVVNQGKVGWRRLSRVVPVLLAAALLLAACGPDAGPPAATVALDTRPASTTTSAPPTATLPPTDVPPTVAPSPTTEPSATPASTSETAAVTRIIDGDTIEVRLNGTIVPVRYIGVNTPESDEPCGEEATRANAQLVAGQTVRLVRDVRDTDRFGRLLRYVYVGDLFVNGELVREGWAEARRYPPDVTLAPLLEQLERDAVPAACFTQALAPTPTEPPPTATARPAPTPAPPTAVPTQAVVPTAIPPTAAPPTADPPTAVPPTAVPPQPTAPPATGSGALSIIAVDKRAEVVTIRNDGAAGVDLSGWLLRSEKGMQDCYLSGMLGPGQTLQIWAMAEDAGQGGFNCGFGGPIWNNSETDTALLIDPGGVVVSSYD